MPLSKHDRILLHRIISYCDDIDKTVSLFSASENTIRENSICRNALAMCILQIGELTTHISDEFKSMYTEIPWRDIRGMRNIAAHHYGEFSATYLWQTIIEDIPAFRQFCESSMSK